MGRQRQIPFRPAEQKALVDRLRREAELELGRDEAYRLTEALAGRGSWAQLQAHWRDRRDRNEDLRDILKGVQGLARAFLKARDHHGWTPVDIQAAPALATLRAVVKGQEDSHGDLAEATPPGGTEVVSSTDTESGADPEHGDLATDPVADAWEGAAAAFLDLARSMDLLLDYEEGLAPSIRKLSEREHRDQVRAAAATTLKDAMDWTWKEVALLELHLQDAPPSLVDHDRLEKAADALREASSALNRRRRAQSQ